MLILQGLLRAATTLPGRTDKKTGEVYPPRDVLQVESVDGRGLTQIQTITVPNLDKYPEQIGKTVNVPVRAWAGGGQSVNFIFEASGAAA